MGGGRQASGNGGTGLWSERGPRTAEATPAGHSLATAGRAPHARPAGSLGLHFAPSLRFLSRTRSRLTAPSPQVVEFGKYELDTWYFSPFPEPYASCPKLYICEYSLKYFRKKRSLLRHLAKLEARHPPGDEIYRSPPPPPRGTGSGGGATAVTDPPIAVFEVERGSRGGEGEGHTGASAGCRHHFGGDWACPRRLGASASVRPW
jgi:hypothetical protein